MRTVFLNMDIKGSIFQIYRTGIVSPYQILSSDMRRMIKEDIINGYINKDKITNINIVQLNNIKSEYVISAIEKTFY